MDLHSFNVDPDPDPAVFLNADPDLDTDPGPGPGPVQLNPLVPGDFFLLNFFNKIGGEVHCMNRNQNLQVQS